MGEVYLAQDTRLGRCVAIKILPDEFSRDAQRMARFDREAKVLASLNHSNIASIYGLEESNSVRALVMEFVDGPTLGERIAKGPLPLDEALPIAKQIAEALEFAHERNIIHRDLKPFNVKITPDGTAKVLDFGLAKASGRRFQRHGHIHFANAEPRGNAGRNSAGHGRVYEPGTSPWEESRPPRRHLVVWRCPVRDADGQARIHGRNNFRHAGRSDSCRA